MRVAEPRCTYQLPIDRPHVLAVNEYGCETGIPVVFLHGGPGSGCRPSLCQLFDLKRFRVIAPDQRGAGNSVPKGSLTENTTRHLLEDLEHVRQQAGIERWFVVGGSWGALLAVAYAEAYPQSVRGMVLRSVFLGAAAELTRAFIVLPRTFYPELYRAFIALLSPPERDDPLRSYYRRILHEDSAIALPAIYAWHDYERVLSELEPSLPVFPDSFTAMLHTERQLPATPRMEAHYFSRQCFLTADQLLENASRLDGIAGVIVQSRYDLLCPPETAYQLSQRWTTGKIQYVEAAAHSQSDPRVASSLRLAIEEIAHVS